MSRVLEDAAALGLIGAALAGMVALAAWLAKAPAGDLRVVDGPADQQPRSLLAVRAVNAPAREWLATQQPATPRAHVGYAAQGEPAAPTTPAAPAAPRERLRLVGPPHLVAANVGEWEVYRADDLADYTFSLDADTDRSSLN